MIRYLLWREQQNKHETFYTYWLLGCAVVSAALLVLIAIVVLT